jgi:hypothetical protein
MNGSESMPERLRDALRRGLLGRLPLTFLPFVNQQISEWEYLFPNERQSTERLLLYVDRLSPEQAGRLFADVVRIEEKMGVRQWQFSTNRQTIQNASELARSPYYRDWRQAVQAVYDEADQNALAANAGQPTQRNRVIILDIPRELPVEQDTVWLHWQELGKRVRLERSAVASAKSALDRILAELLGRGAQRDAAQNPQDRSARNPPADTWVIDGSRSIVEALLTQEPTLPERSVLLGFNRLDAFRENFSHEMNSMLKNLADADSVLGHLRKVDVLPWCPPEVASVPAVREFVRSLFLSGNGAVIFGNSFAEWAASEAIRRARPRFLAVRFGVRSKPKPFTSVVVFENPDRVNPLPSVDDEPGSAIDAEILAAYIWLSTLRYEEYRRSTVCICLAESINEAYLVAPPEFGLGQTSEPISVDAVAESLRSWMAG